MANLKGSTFEKQIKNALNRLEARGTKRHLAGSNKTHSNALTTKREMYLRDFKNYAENNNLTGKLNNLMTKEHVKNFLENRLENLSAKTGLSYISGFNSMLKGLENTKVPINEETKNFLKEIRAEYQVNFNSTRENFETNRSISNIEAFKSDLRAIREESEVIATLQLETGLRAAEALEVAKNFNNYYNPDNNTLNGIIGKGGQEYYSKDINPVLAEKIANLENIPSYSTYNRDVHELGHKTHDLRITYAKETYEEKIEAGYTEKEALKETSEELNHHRESITAYYLKRA
jgi:predicted RNA-binding protein Jag